MRTQIALESNSLSQDGATVIALLKEKWIVNLVLC